MILEYKIYKKYIIYKIKYKIYNILNEITWKWYWNIMPSFCLHCQNWKGEVDIASFSKRLVHISQRNSHLIKINWTLLLKMNFIPMKSTTKIGIVALPESQRPDNKKSIKTSNYLSIFVLWILFWYLWINLLLSYILFNLNPVWDSYRNQSLLF